MAHTEYSQKLKSPFWQKKRLLILERDNWSCILCKDSKSNLQVHHVKYEKGKQPWEYEDHDLITLCESCHEKEHGKDKNDMYSIIQDQILLLHNSLQNNLTWKRQQEVLSQIVGLQKRRKELTFYAK